MGGAKANRAGGPSGRGIGCRASESRRRRSVSPKCWRGLGVHGVGRDGSLPPAFPIPSSFRRKPEPGTFLTASWVPDSGFAASGMTKAKAPDLRHQKKARWRLFRTPPSSPSLFPLPHLTALARHITAPIRSCHHSGRAGGRRDVRGWSTGRLLHSSVPASSPPPPPPSTLLPTAHDLLCHRANTLYG
jgi:hypothetical protein